MKGKEILDQTAELMETYATNEGRIYLNTAAHVRLLEIHSRALAAHCECLGMNAENMWAAIANKVPPYAEEQYFTTMKKWGLINEKGEPII